MKGNNGEIRDLNQLHDEIDQCDREIVDLLNRRADAVQEIGRLKSAVNGPVFVPSRENAVYDKVESFNEGPLMDKDVRSIYREIMSVCIALQAPTRVAYHGPPGSFTHLAAIQKFGTSIEYFPVPEIRDVFEAVVREHVHFGLVPIENSSDGAIFDTANRLMDTNVKICSEVYLELHYGLLSNCPLSDVELILGTPNAFIKSRNWLLANMPNTRNEEVAHTYQAVERASLEYGVAAIANESSLALFEFDHIEKCIENKTDDVTRFIVLAQNTPRESGNDLTSIAFFLRNQPGSLYKILAPFQEHDVSILRIQNFPTKKKNWEHAFLVDFEGHVDNENVSNTLSKVNESAEDFRILGSYPKSEVILGAKSFSNGIKLNKARK
ncbi:MAG TPA: prephenate dehydratase domain-containing protein [bacterium]|jgi:chorismate mutase/prephenate dehydratase